MMHEGTNAGATLDGLPVGARVVVAMSGGVDSSVTAALAVEQGFDVVGVTLQLYDHGQATRRAGACCAGQDIHDARRVAESLDIPHYVLDFEARFKAAVIDDFAAGYAEGRTPIPCVRCNQRIKFRDLMEIARDLGAPALVTGHYARRLDEGRGAELHRAVDDDRDQSYFLFATTPAQLDFLRFPLGGLAKDETRRIAGRLGLAVADKPDSQDICFVPSGRYDRIVGRLRPEAMAPGEIVDGDGRVLGRHDGIARFTVGQRRGIGVASDERLYVSAIDAPRRRVVVGRREASRSALAELDEVNWLGNDALPATGMKVLARHRARQPLAAAEVRPAGDGRATVAFDQPQYGVAPGQACVLYDGTRLLGGGWMRATAP